MVKAAEKGEAISIGLIGNIVELWERCVERGVHVDLGSDQTSLHNPYQGGYFPADRTYDESARMLSEEPERFKSEVQATLRRHAAAVNTMAERGMYFWDYGNAFLLEASRVGADVVNDDGSFRYPSYVRTSWGRCALITASTVPLGLHERRSKRLEENRRDCGFSAQAHEKRRRRRHRSTNQRQHPMDRTSRRQQPGQQSSAHPVCGRRGTS